MRKLLISAAVAMALTACASPGGGSGATGGGVDQSVAQQVQQITAQACSFVPVLADIADVLAANQPGITTAGQIAKAICEAVNRVRASAVAGRRAAAPTVVVAGVTVRGRFLR